MNSNTNADINGYFAQMGSAPRAPAHRPGIGHAHDGLSNRSQNNFNPPTAPAAMRAGGTTRYSLGSVQWRPNPLGTMNDIQGRLGGQCLVKTAGLGDGWYK